MRVFFAALTIALFSVTACGKRQVEVRTAPQQAAEASVHMTNNLSTPVNVYVTSGGTDIFLGQVGGGQSVHLPVRGVAANTTVTLKATTVNNSRTYSKDSVVLAGTYAWTVP
jgi:hypothetical protein